MTTSKPFTMITIGLLLTSLISLTTTAMHNHHKAVVVKADHRVVVVEYDNDPDGSTRVSISPHDRSGSGTNPVCDAYGKCKHIIANAVTKPVHWVSNKAQEVEEHAKDTVNEAIRNLPHDLRESKAKLLEASGKVSDHRNIAQGVSKMEVAGDVIGIVKDGILKAKNFDVVDSPKRIVEDISWNVTRGVNESVEQAEECVTCVREICRKCVHEVVSKVKQVTYDVIWYILYIEKIGLVHMLGFSTAYGTCVWVTFVSSYILGRCLPREMFGMVQSRIYPVYFRAMAYCVLAALLGHLVSQKSEGLTSKIGVVQSLSLGSALLMLLVNMMLLEPKATKAIYKRMKLEKKEGRGVRVAVPPKDGMVDGGGPTMVSKAYRRGVRVAAAAWDGMGDGSAGMADGIAAETEISAANEKAKGGGSRSAQDALRLNEKLKRLNAYSSALNLFTLVALTWHMAYTSQRLQGI